MCCRICNPMQMQRLLENLVDFLPQRCVEKLLIPDLTLEPQKLVNVESLEGIKHEKIKIENRKDTKDKEPAELGIKA